VSAFVSVFLAAAVIALTVLPHCTADRRLHRACFAADLALCILGAVLLILSRCLAAGLFSDAALTEDFRAWAQDVYFLWVCLSGVLAAVAGGAVLAAAVIRHPMRRVRHAVAAAVSLILLIVGGGYTALAENAAADLTTPVRLWTWGCAVLVLAGIAADAARSMKNPPAAPKKKKKL